MYLILLTQGLCEYLIVARAQSVPIKLKVLLGSPGLPTQNPPLGSLVTSERVFSLHRMKGEGTEPDSSSLCCLGDGIRKLFELWGHWRLGELNPL